MFLLLLRQYRWLLLWWNRGIGRMKILGIGRNSRVLWIRLVRFRSGGHRCICGNQNWCMGRRWFRRIGWNK